MSANKSSSNSPTLSVHDPEFKNLITVPLSAVHHLPPAHLEISRLVLCRKFDPREPETSCSMGTNCKFVHIDMSHPQLNVQSIHVNYAYRNADEIQHETLPAGESLSVLAPNNRAPSQMVPSELIIVTKGALNRHNSRGPLSHCAHYYYNRMCNRGERCGFLHAAFIDANAQEFQRAPPRAGASTSANATKSCSNTEAPRQMGTQVSVHPNQPATFRPATMNSPSAVVPPLAHHTPSHPAALSNNTKQLSAMGFSSSNGSSSHELSSCDLSESPRSEHSSGCYTPTQETTATTPPKRNTRTVYRHNPYSLLEVSTIIA